MQDLKMRDQMSGVKMQDLKMQEQMSGVKMQDLKMRDQKTRTRKWRTNGRNVCSAEEICVM